MEMTSTGNSKNKSPADAVDSHPSTNPAVWPFLGYVRFLLAFGVAVQHYDDAYQSSGLCHELAGFGGFNSVLAFLVISGFSVAHSLIGNPHKYVWRRFLRIYPLFVLSLAVAVVYPAMTVHGQNVREHLSIFDIVGQLLMLDGVVTHTVSGNGPLWSIGLEWWCYMLAPLLVRLSERRMLALLAALAVVHLGWIVVGPRLGGFYGRPYGGQKILFLAVFWILGFWYYRYRSKAFSSLVLLGLMWFLTGLNRDNMGRNYQTALCVSCVALVLAERIRLSAALTRVGNFVGSSSYALYLFHVPVFRALREVAHLNSPCAILLITCVAAALIQMVAEEPLRNAMKAAGRWYDRRHLGAVSHG